jgi:hypothetical protein
MAGPEGVPLAKTCRKRAKTALVFERGLWQRKAGLFAHMPKKSVFERFRKKAGLY